MVENVLDRPSPHWYVDNDTVEKYHFRVEHRPRTQHRNAVGLCKRTNDYRWGEQLEKLPPVAERWNFLSQDEYERLPAAPWFDVQGRIIPNHPDLPPHLQNLHPNPPKLVQRVIRRTKRIRQRDKQKDALQEPLPPPPPSLLHAHEDFYLDYLEDWMDVTEETHHEYLLPTHVANVASRTTYALAETNEATLQSAPKMSNRQCWPFGASAVHGIKDLILAQNRDVHILALEKLVNNENIDQEIFPDDVRGFARNYCKQKKDLLFLNSNGVLCVKYSPSQRSLHERPCMNVMPQLYQIFFVLTMLWAIRALAKLWPAYKNATPGQAFVVLLANTSANASLVSKFVTNRRVFAFTSRTYRVGTSMS